MNEKRKFNVLELAAGGGGLALGLEKAGFETSGLIEIDKWAIETLKINRPEWNVIQGDINIIANDIYKYVDKEVDVISGGFPCQPFSYAGKGMGFQDDRGHLFFSFIKIVQALKPKALLFENVKGLISNNKGVTFSTMINLLEESGYTVYHQVLNANDYGVGQKRHRVFIIGIRNDLNFKEFKFPKPDSKKLVLKDILLNVPKSNFIPYPKEKAQVLSLVPPGGCWRDLPDGVAKTYMKGSYYLSGGKTGIARRLSWNEPSLTLTTSPMQGQTERCHPDETRPFTIREYARIQSFPDEWIFSGSLNNQYKQIGNAVPVELGRRVAQQLFWYLEEATKMKDYKIDNFISEESLREHVRETILKYFKTLDDFNLKKFNDNLIDPIKLTFDMVVFENDLEQVIKNEILRQIDKTLNNQIGYFNQNLFTKIKDKSWTVPINGQGEGFDIKNESKKIYVEMKNKHNTMNSSSASATRQRMREWIKKDQEATCYLLEVISKYSQDKPWVIKTFSNERIRKISIDKFMEIISGDPLTFFNLSKILPSIIKEEFDQVKTKKKINSQNIVLAELKEFAKEKNIELNEVLFYLAFEDYYGFKK